MFLISLTPKFCVCLVLLQESISAELIKAKTHPVGLTWSCLSLVASTLLPWIIAEVLGSSCNPGGYNDNKMGVFLSLPFLSSLCSLVRLGFFLEQK